MNSLNFSNDKHTSFSVLVTAPAETRAALRPVFADEALAGWDVVEAEDLARAQFALQHGYCDVWLVDDRLCRAEEESGLAQFAARQKTPVLLLTDPVPERIGRALDWGCAHWASRDQATNPGLLRVLLQQTVRWSELRQLVDRRAGQLQDCRRRIHRMIDMLWGKRREQAASSA